MRLYLFDLIVLCSLFIETTAASTRFPTASPTVSFAPVVSTPAPSSTASPTSLSPLSDTTSYSYTGSLSYVKVPDDVNALYVYLWGAGGDGYYTVDSQKKCTGGGAYIEGTLLVTPGEILSVLVGQGGSIFRNGSFGGGGANGGGRSAIRRDSEDIVTAGGGGGAGSSVSFGLAAKYNSNTPVFANCTTNGYSGNGTVGGCGQPRGMKYQGGVGHYSSYYYSGGGGGYYGGGAGLYQAYGGGAGSSYIANLVEGCVSCEGGNNACTCAGTYSSQYSSGQCGAGDGPGQSGYVVIELLYNYTYPPTASPSIEPTAVPSVSDVPSMNPSTIPTMIFTEEPTNSPNLPTAAPSLSMTLVPTIVNSSRTPTRIPTSIVPSSTGQPIFSVAHSVSSVPTTGANAAGADSSTTSIIAGIVSGFMVIVVLTGLYWWTFIRKPGKGSFKDKLHSILPITDSHASNAQQSKKEMIKRIDAKVVPIQQKSVEKVSSRYPNGKWTLQIDMATR